MKISLIQFSIFFFVILFISGCCLGEKDKYNYVPENRKLIYEEGDKLIYESNPGNLDTIVFTQVEQDLWVEQEFYRCDTKEYNETVYYRFSFSKYKNEKRLLIIQDYGGVVGLIWLNGYLYDFYPDLMYDYDFYQIGAKEYKNIYLKYSPDRLEPYSVDDGLKTVELLFSCTEGVIQFSIEGGETWVLKSVIKK